MQHDPKPATYASTATWRPVQSDSIGRPARTRDGVPGRQDQEYRLLPIWQVTQERAAASSRTAAVPHTAGEVD